MNKPSLPANSRTTTELSQLWLYVLGGITLLYLLVVILPTSWSGLAGLTPQAIVQGRFSVLLYPEPLTLPAVMFGLAIVLTAWASVPLASGYMYECWQARTKLARRTLLRSVCLASICVVLISATTPISYRFIVWLID